MSENELAEEAVLPAVVGVAAAVDVDVAMIASQDGDAGTVGVDSDAAPAMFAVGDTVLAFYAADGNEYPVTVAEVRDDGTFLVDWADGDPQDRVKTAEQMQMQTIKLLDTVAEYPGGICGNGSGINKLTVGDRVEAGAEGIYST